MKVVLVTGGSRGLGMGMVRDLLGTGYRVATCSRNGSEEMYELQNRCANDGKFVWLPCAIGDESQEEELVGRVEQWARGDVLYALINNAGIAGEGILATFPNVDSERIIQINLLGALRLSRLVLRTMLAKRTAGRIVNVSSIIGCRGYTGLSAYSASKAGLDGLTRSLAREVGRRGITVNSVAPGYLDTEMSSSLSGRQREQIERRTPLGRLGTVEDVVPIVRFLLSDDARFITGQTIIVDGGISC